MSTNTTTKIRKSTTQSNQEEQGEDGKTLPKTLENLNSSKNDLIELFTLFGVKVCTHLAEQEKFQSNFVEHLSRQEQSVNKIHTQLESFGEDVGDLRTKFRFLNNALSQLKSNIEAKDVPDDQNRVLLQNVARKIEQLDADVFEHRVEPFFKELSRLSGGLQTLVEKKGGITKDEVQAVAGDVERFLEMNDLAIIKPETGDRFDPKIHQPLSRRDTTHELLHGKIAATHHPGLIRSDGKVIQHARVEIFFLVEDQPENEEEK